MLVKPLEEGLGEVLLDGGCGEGGGGVFKDTGRCRCVGDGGRGTCMPPTGVVAVVEEGRGMSGEEGRGKAPCEVVVVVEGDGGGEAGCQAGEK
jgi:hypothetical protein